MAERVKFAPCSVKQQMVLLDKKTDVLLVGGGAGGSKSYACLMKALDYVKDPKARVIILRTTYPILKLQGGLIDESKSIYSHFGAKFGLQSLTWTFPNGATIQFRALPDNMQDFQGLQATNILVDEACPDFKQEHILFLLSRLRGASYKGHLNLVMTCNPDRHSFLYDWLEPYCLDPDTGVPKPGTENITRWFVNLGGTLHWGDSVKELYEKHGAGYILGKDFIPLSFRFIPLTVYDNPILLKNNPRYLANLLSQPRVNQLRYLHGSWTAIDASAGFFKREWVEIVDHPPINPVSKVRSWDLAASVPSETNRDVDWSSGTLMSRDRDGYYYIEHVNRFQKLSDGVLKEIIKTSQEDGDDVPITIPKDPAAAGKVANQFQVSYLIERGVRSVKSINTSGGTSKVNKFKPFASMAENRKIRVVRGDWNEAFFTELEHFDGGRKGHDDQVDSTSDAFNTLCRQIDIPVFSLPQLTQTSIVPKI